MLAAASFVDNAVGAWAPTLLIRDFSKDPAQVGVELGLLLTAGFGGGVLIGGVLADRAGARGGWQSKLRVCLCSGLLILPVSLLMNSSLFRVVLAGIPLYFALSGIVTAVGFSAILDAVPNRSRGLAMSMSFFLNVALGAGMGPTAVALAGVHVFGARQGLGPPLALTVAGGYFVALVALWAALSIFRPRPDVPSSS
jgi:MFS family permease